ncbi:MAG: NAD(P)/FAD-dependent oxidoreductase, partial [Candidatus Gastranaerophilales bacterium]|nr:NAD(P)/FAD-dependent oxidoreductase [Candidatus Gastranaerophilales bacterium]
SLFLNKEYSYDNPLEISLKFVEDDNFNLQDLLNNNSKKKVSTLLAEFMPKSLVKIVLEQSNLNDKFCHEIVKDERKILESILTELNINVTGALKDNVIVSSGGVDLKEINSKTMESKIIKNLFFCGEVVDIDGFCGGYNLQNCWSTGYVAGMSL